MAETFYEPVGLSGCNRLAIYDAWGTTMQQAYPAFKDNSCSYCGRITSADITLSSDAATGMVSRIGVTVNTTTLPADTVLADLQAAPVTPFAPRPFAPAAASASKAAAGNLPSTGNWTLSFTLVTRNQTEQCPLPVQSISCMPTFVRTPSGGCECSSGYQNAIGVCTPIPSACDLVAINLTAGDSAPRGTANSIITASISQPPGVAAKIVAVPKNSAVDVVPNAPATLPATGDWSVTLSVGDQLCPNKTLLVTVRCAAGFIDVNGQCSCPAGSENVGGKCVTEQSVCDKAVPQFSLSASSATGAYANLRVLVSADLPANGTVELLAVPQNATVKVPPFQPASPGSVVLPSTGSWSMQLSVNGEPCTGLPPLTVTCLPGFVGTPSGGCECPSGEKNIDGKCEPITDKPKTACEVATFLPGVTQLTDNTTVSLGFSDSRDPSQVNVLMRPKVAVRTASASNPSALLGLGQVVPGDYEIELEQGGSRCPLVSVNVGCSPGYQATGGINGTCRLKDTTVCTADQWIDPTTKRCRWKAEMAVRSSSETLEMTLVKTRSITSVTAQLEVRLKTGDIDAGTPIKWMASPSRTDAGWLSFSPSSGVVFSGGPVAPITVIVNGTGLNDTGPTGRIVSSITITSTSSDPIVFTNGIDDVQSIPVRLFITAVPYVDMMSDVTLTSSSGRVVPPGEPVEAGDRLTIAVKAYDAQRLPISRQDLQLTVEVTGKLNGAYSVPLELSSPGSNAVTNVYTATIPENSIKEPGIVESDDLPSSAARFR
jgi:hypothetical protein